MNNNINPNTGNNINAGSSTSLGNNIPANAMPQAADSNTIQQVNTPRPQNNDNIVAPTAVDLSKVQVNNNDTMINRERENIVSATIQANSAIDKKMAKDVNNQIKVKKISPLKIAIVVILVMVFTISLAFGVVKLAKYMMDYGESEPNQTTTTTQVNNAITYLNEMDKVRKYQSKNSILLLSPSGYDLPTNQNIFMYLIIDTKGITKTESGTYNINGEVLELTTSSNTILKFDITPEGLVNDGETLAKNDQEMKSYSYKNDGVANILIINGTIKYEQALFIQSSTTTSYNVISFTETKDDITLDNGITFVKKDINVVYNNQEYTFES